MFRTLCIVDEAWAASSAWRPPRLDH